MRLRNDTTHQIIPSVYLDEWYTSDRNWVSSPVLSETKEPGQEDGHLANGCVPARLGDRAECPFRANARDEFVGW